jgi:hypothetical protein
MRCDFFGSAHYCIPEYSSVQDSQNTCPPKNL